LISIPSFLLKRLYVIRSLRNNSDGFQFEIENKLGSAGIPRACDNESLFKALLDIVDGCTIHKRFSVIRY
jgi:hypothetical protein